METGYPGATVTLFALSDGTTSLYISNGGGVLGGHAHESVRRANAAFLKTANQYRNHFEPTQSFPVPETGQTIFYALTDLGILAGGGNEKELGNNRHELSTLFYAGQGVLTELRLVAERPANDARRFVRTKP